MWEQRRLIFRPDGQHPQMRSHASLPTPIHLEGDRYRVYFASRDTNHRSHVWFVDLDVTDPERSQSTSPKPVLEPGPPGHFDDSGVYAASIVQHNDTLWMYYIGWNAGVPAPMFYSSIGLAVSEDGGHTFQKHSQAPIMARSEHDPCLVTSPCVHKENEVWRMWYVSGFKWEQNGDTLDSYYHIKYAESADGLRWQREGVVCIDHRIGEKNIARPCVLRDHGIYKMWYPFSRGDGYRIGYAESDDGIGWTRMDELGGMDVSISGWDDDAVAYPWVFRHSDRRYVLYNGNHFGRGGFGLAIERSR